MTEYLFQKIEKKWQAIWQERGDYATNVDSDKPKMYLLIEFPYPSGAGLHVGHPRSYVAMDILARKRRMEGYEVMFPIGFDAFGLPAENYAIKFNIHPRITTEQNISNFRRQLTMLGLSFDWNREVNTTEPTYYKWTQWMFLRMFEKGLAYKSLVPINWCPSCHTSLANEEVLSGNCERCATPVVRREKAQWMLRITAYADPLIDDLDTVDFIAPVVEQQRNWIGRSHGAEVHFPIDGTDERLTVFTTRPDTLFGATYMVIAPEHPLLEAYAAHIINPDAVRAYREASARKSDIERTELAGQKSGVPIEGLWALNPATGGRIPIWVSDYVLMSYGTGAIMAVPAHDTRDYEFARKFDLPIVEVVQGGDVSRAAYTDSEGGRMVNSGLLDGLEVSKAKKKIIAWLQDKGYGDEAISYRMRDWVFSRQRYWGEPIPLVECDTCGWVPVPEQELPVLLPEVEEFRPSADGHSPLHRLDDWVHTACPKCGGAARRETDTMPQWAGSCWYFLRYLDPNNGQTFARPEILARWMPVDWYNGGMEHTTLHLLYSRFWYKFLYDEGFVPTPEPYKRRTSHGMILGEDREKMSKSRGNVVNPDDVVAQYGADTFRVYEMFLGDFEKVAIWIDHGVIGIHRFLKKCWLLQIKLDEDADPDRKQLVILHRMIHNVDDRIERMKFNTAISAIMEYVNELVGFPRIPRLLLDTLSKVLYPFAPHIAEEIWQNLGNQVPLATQSWPQASARYLVEDTITMAVQVNGKMRGNIEVPVDISQAEAIERCFAQDRIAAHIDRAGLMRTVFVPGKIINLIGNSGQ
uniref:Leucine--tRNA ligase n=1 Tax=Candidatus Kentrum sp. UNK TaxID=2126344 RepID=A0A451AF33_9GAMM|nr:MAG: leucyl-tRNA synthetase [Candidatus Kentron sp. UNK]VFK71169.1 MAG: leucyl-tRNA synthetase [Candidatus Kentron sp. UNK]